MSRALLDRAAIMLALITTALAVTLHLVFGWYAGALWRDEVGTLDLSTVKTFGEMWNNLDYDSIPALFLLVLRPFAGVPADISDSALRAFGVTIGLLVLAAVWLNARQFRSGVPLLSLALIGFNPMVTRYGDSIRGYGLGTLLILLTMGALWQLVEKRSARNIILAAIAAILSVHCLYYNAVFLLAISLGAVAVCIRREQWKTAVIILSIGATSALSILPYAFVIRRVSAWNFQFKQTIDYAFLWGKLSKTLDAPMIFMRWLWVALFLLAIFTAVYMQLRRGVNDEGRTGRDAALFALVAMLVSSIGYAIFLRRLSYVTHPWYYVVPIALLSVCFEIIFTSFSRTIWPLLGRGAVAALVAGAAFLPNWDALTVRQTNVDVIAQRLGSVARNDDLILINSWNYGIPFQRYYKGEATVSTIPPIADLRFHRCDLAKRQMMSPAPLAPLLQEMEKTLRSGHTVWIVGSLQLPPQGQEPLTPPPGYDGANGWEGGDFYRAWSEQVASVLSRHMESFELVRLPLPQQISAYEHLPLAAIRGWRGDSLAAK